jgi:hypothetical protein
VLLFGKSLVWGITTSGDMYADYCIPPANQIMNNEKQQQELTGHWTWCEQQQQIAALLL